MAGQVISVLITTELLSRNSAPQIEVDRTLSALSVNIVLQIVLLKLFIFSVFCILLYGVLSYIPYHLMFSHVLSLINKIK